jgi:hypothetical protein
MGPEVYLPKPELKTLKHHFPELLPKVGPELDLVPMLLDL